MHENVRNRSSTKVTVTFLIWKWSCSSFYKNCFFYYGFKKRFSFCKKVLRWPIYNLYEVDEYLRSSKVADIDIFENYLRVSRPLWANIGHLRKTSAFFEIKWIWPCPILFISHQSPLLAIWHKIRPEFGVIWICIWSTSRSGWPGQINLNIVRNKIILSAIFFCIDIVRTKPTIVGDKREFVFDIGFDATIGEIVFSEK